MRDGSNPAVRMDILRRHVESARREGPEKTRSQSVFDWTHNRNRPDEWLLTGFFLARYADARKLPADEVLRIARWYADAPSEDCRRGLGSLAGDVMDWPAVVELVRLGLGLPPDAAPVCLSHAMSRSRS